MTTLRSEHPRVFLALVAGVVPLLLGAVTTAAWTLLGGGPVLNLSVGFEWLPLLAGLGVCLLVVLWALTVWVTHGRLVRALAALRKSEAERRLRLMGRLDHELKNPIQGIRAALADEPSERQLTHIERQTARLAGVLSDLRKISEVDHAELENTRVDVTELVKEAIETVREAPGGHERTLTAALPVAPRPLPEITGDPDLLFLAFTNVIANAVKYSEPGATVEVRGHYEAPWVTLEFADTGRGIPPDEVELVWEELGRSRESRGIPGSGLGLPLVRAIIERHGGSATMESWHGEGSTVTVRLPA